MGVVLRLSSERRKQSSVPQGSVSGLNYLMVRNGDE